MADTNIVDTFYTNGTNQDDLHGFDSSGTTNDVVKWDVRDINLTAFGSVVDDFTSFEYNNDREVTHIETLRGVVGFNLHHIKPTWAIRMRITSSMMSQFIKAKRYNYLFNITFAVSDYIEVDCTSCLITQINTGTFGMDANEVVIQGLALKIAENYTTENLTTGTAMTFKTYSGGDMTSY